MTRDLNATGRWLKRLTQGLAPEPQDRKELLRVLREAAERGLLDGDALTMLEGVLEVGDLQVRDIMVPRAARAGPPPLGELVICPRVLEAEARAQDKTRRAHWAHLVVHGALHLAGYDHARAADARRMERREIAVLRRLGFGNPYRERSA